MKIFSTRFFHPAVSLISVTFITAVLWTHDFGVLKTFGTCAVLLVASKHHRHASCESTSTMALGARALAESQAMVSRCDTLRNFWIGHVVFG